MDALLVKERRLARKMQQASQRGDVEELSELLQKLKILLETAAHDAAICAERRKRKRKG